MVDKREKQLAYNLVNYSCRVQKAENVLIEYYGVSDGFLQALANEVFAAGANPFFNFINKAVLKDVIANGSKELFSKMAEFDKLRMKNMHAVIIIKGEENAFEFKDIPSEQTALYNNHYYMPVHMNIRLNKKWVNLRYPTKAFAQSAQMSTTSFENYYFKVCNLDYSKMCKAMEPLKALMKKTDKVKVVAKNTMLEFSIKDIGVVKCCGEKNIPDGEIYTAPVKLSVNGHIEFNIPTVHGGVMHSDVRLKFENGKVVAATSSHTSDLISVLNTDEGSRYFGEFAFGVNPFIKTPINDILFDEKMHSSIHFALGNSYENACNGNKSAIHWDLIQSHSTELGGGKIYFDNVLVRENGRFILPELLALNADNLV